MQLVVLANDRLMEELLKQGTEREIKLTWIKDPNEFLQHHTADGYIDLLFDNSKQRIDLLKKLSSKPVIINSVATTLQEIDAPFIRINAWPSFLKRNFVEAAAEDDELRQKAEIFFYCLNKKMEWLHDDPGFVSARVVAMIINEAYFTLGESVSTKKEIDIAMKLGTNYPYGPFEWCGIIGIKNIYRLLTQLSKINERYNAAPLLEKEASS